MTAEVPQIDPRQAALLVMDFQNGIVGRLPGAQELLARTAGAIDLVRQRGGHVGYVRVGFTDADLAAIPATSGMAAVARSAPAGDAAPYHADSPATAVHDAVAPQPGDIVVRKTRVGAFSTTDLDAQLRSRGVDTLILAGISTSGVLLSTVRDAHDRDYRLFVLADGSADPRPEVHDFLVGQVFPRQATVITTAQLPALLGS